jgi:hypothetical protein
MTDDEVVAKFSRQAEGIISNQTARQIVDTAMALEKLPDVSPLIEFETL